jgi:hypothetical protein
VDISTYIGYIEENNMKYTIEFKPEYNAAVIIGTGNVTRNGISSFHNEYLNDERWEPGMNIIIDFRELYFSNFQSDDIDFIKDLVIGSREEMGDGKLAIIISSENDFGLGRMWEIKTDSFVDFGISVFREIDEALEWLERPPE